MWKAHSNFVYLPTLPGCPHAWMGWSWSTHLLLASVLGSLPYGAVQQCRRMQAVAGQELLLAETVRWLC